MRRTRHRLRMHFPMSFSHGVLIDPSARDTLSLHHRPGLRGSSRTLSRFSLTHCIRLQSYQVQLHTRQEENPHRKPVGDIFGLSTDVTPSSGCVTFRILQSDEILASSSCFPGNIGRCLSAGTALSMCRTPKRPRCWSYQSAA